MPGPLRGYQGPSTAASSNEGQVLRAAIHTPHPTTLSPCVVKNSDQVEDKYHYSDAEKADIEKLDMLIAEQNEYH